MKINTQQKRIISINQSINLIRPQQHIQVAQLSLTNPRQLSLFSKLYAPYRKRTPKHFRDFPNCVSYQ